MDFFTAQDRARRLSGRLVLLLLLAVVALVALTCMLVSLAVVMLDTTRMHTGDPLTAALEPRLLAMVAGGVMTVVILGGLVRHLQLRVGGYAVAEALGGRPLALDTRDAGDRPGRKLSAAEHGRGTAARLASRRRACGATGFGSGADGGGVCRHPVRQSDQGRGESPARVSGRRQRRTIHP
ncbi:hypothetical protein [Halomonas sp. KAO]|uniref:hypothetical protein n=1 Tax=Halomonas sp. KAO TaxID=2783858 RepID=UPI002B4C11AB|nr:hypothetical protein [Halomonas sp. KAO]